MIHDANKPYPLHEKYDLDDVVTTKVCNFDGVIVKAYRQQRPDKTINLDLPVFFVYNLEDNEWVLVKGPTSKYYDKEVYAHVERQAEEADPCVKWLYWYDHLDQSCKDPKGIGGGDPIKKPCCPDP